MLDFKYQFIGNENSKFATSTGLGYIFGLNAFLLPLYFSYHPTNKVAIYFSPRTINEYNFRSSMFINDLNGFAAGIKVGKSNSIIMEYSLYKNMSSNKQKYLNQITIGFVLRRSYKKK